MNSLIAIIDDEPDILELVSLHLTKAGFSVREFADAESFNSFLETNTPDLIVLDLMLPDTDGLELCKTLKKKDAFASIPIIMLTAKGEETDKILGLELGADDYVTKPFSPRELVLRVKSILRRTKGEGPEAEVLRQGDLLVDHAKHRVTLKGKPVELTATEFKLLATLMERRGRVQTRDRLLGDVWEYTGDVDTRTVDTHVRRLREKLGKAADAIETVRGVGYRFAE